MPANLTQTLIAEMFKQESGQAFLTLVTLSHPTWAESVRLVNNSSDVISRGQVFIAFPFTIVLPPDDGESTREAQLVLDNTTLEIITRLRAVTDEVGVKLEMVLSNLPNDIQMSIEDLVIRNITYNVNKITARLTMDNFLQTELTSEKYTPSRFYGIF